MKLKKGDTVIITSGKDRGKKGKIEKIFPQNNSIFIAGLNIYKRHLKKRDEKNPGGIVEISRPIPISNVSLICPKCQKPARIGFQIEGNTKSRLCRKCGSVI